MVRARSVRRLSAIRTTVRGDVVELPLSADFFAGFGMRVWRVMALGIGLAGAASQALAADFPEVSAPPVATGLRATAVRLRPGDDLRARIEAVVRETGFKAAYVASVVGSVDGVALRLADQPQPTVLPGHREIVSLVGTLGPDGAHLHLAVADANGAVVGGHLVEGTRVYTTAEVVLVELPGLRFERAVDDATGFKELRVVPSP